MLLNKTLEFKSQTALKTYEKLRKKLSFIDSISQLNYK